eukprot:CAMPEP_0118694876 /NCGR_PEP_ID=MMETSP0800-20121206/12817_1 /TAXON_ID=210618 ORGANISM="Striatella unipunctata, Strain CCMP2910" /NCGR_SAMPLE_ID=MMETSP0800 /ASSEMBLY_ACC=CAM_ASM_000638 /LENGTH=96 /DNA_ID=CAMNT_0006593491 /DNA_START=154 /DNA_END=444 /DNA_ORIENTATION=-
MSFVSQILAPGGGMLLIPFIKIVICILMLTCGAACIAGVAQIHMAILLFLSSGLLYSLTWFEAEFAKVQGAKRSQGGGGGTTTTTTSTRSTTDKTD